MNQKTPGVLVFRGLAGTGKSTLSGAYSERHNLPLLCKDTIYDVCARHVPEHTTRNKIAYDSLYAILAANAKTGSSFVVDYPFQKAPEIEGFLAWAEETGYRARSVLVTCSDEQIWSNRFAKRSENPSPNQILTSLAEFKEYYGGSLYIAPLHNEIVVDTIHPVDQLLANLESELNSAI